MRESKIEAELVRQVRAAGGECYKFVSPGRRGVPDRLVILPGGRVAFVECKAPGRRATVAQVRELMKLRTLGATAAIVDSTADVDWLLRGAM